MNLAASASTAADGKRGESRARVNRNRLQRCPATTGSGKGAGVERSGEARAWVMSVSHMCPSVSSFDGMYLSFLLGTNLLLDHLN
jgi:hypothetical protein